MGVDLTLLSFGKAEHASYVLAVIVANCFGVFAFLGYRLHRKSLVLNNEGGSYIIFSLISYLIAFVCAGFFVTIIT